LDADFDQIESFIANIANSQEPQKLIDTANQIAQLSESIPLDKIPDSIERQQDELQKLDEQIEQAGATLKKKNIDIQTVEEYKRLDEELEKYGFSMNSLQKLVSVLLKINQLGYDALKIVKEWARIKSLKQTERILNKNCTTLESRAARFREVLPMCEQVMRLGIGFRIGGISYRCHQEGRF
jgi:DNA repair exonuclease SbcCD ATPase subunit